MKKIFELRYSDYYNAVEFTDEVKFFEKIGYDDLIEFLTTHDKYELLSVKHLIKHAEDEFNEYLEEQYPWYYDNDEYHFEDFKDDFIIEDDFDLELYDFMLSELNEKQLESVLKEIGIKFGTVGYSPWCYYLALYDVSNDFISDLYNGYNIYDIIQYDENGNQLDRLGWVYAPNTSDIIEHIKDHFILNNDDGIIYLEENDASTYIEHEKIKKVKSYYEKRFII